MEFNTNNLKWTREPNQYKLDKDKIEIVTMPQTDLWQQTYYHFRNDNAPVLQYVQFVGLPRRLPTMGYWII